MSKSETVNITHGYHVTARNLERGPGVTHGYHFTSLEFAIHSAVNVHLMSYNATELAEQLTAHGPTITCGPITITLEQTPESFKAKQTQHVTTLQGGLVTITGQANNVRTLDDLNLLTPAGVVDAIAAELMEYASRGEATHLILPTMDEVPEQAPTEYLMICDRNNARGYMSVSKNTAGNWVAMIHA